MLSHERQYSSLDKLLVRFDSSLRAFSGVQAGQRANPAHDLPEPELNKAQAHTAANLMRVNHAGEVAAQGLYHGQAFTAKRASIRQHMQHAAIDEGDHLIWCAQRLHELDSHISYLTPFWYAGSFALGAFAGVLGDAWSLGFVAETEAQVEQHLTEHLQRLPEADAKSRAILAQMRDDEVRHGQQALNKGGKALPAWVQAAMAGVAKVMKVVAFRF